MKVELTYDEIYYLCQRSANLDSPEGLWDKLTTARSQHQSVPSCGIYEELPGPDGEPDYFGVTYSVRP
jgi:hypothetical protein